MNANKDQEERFLLSFSDILVLFRKYRKLIFWCAFLGGLGGGLMALIQPIRYQAEAIFREKGVKSGNSSSSSFMQLLGAGNLLGGESEATSFMTSRKILKDVVEKLHLQARLESKSSVETIPRLLKNNLRLLWNTTIRPSPFPALKDLSSPLKIEDLQYTGENPMALMLNLQKDGRYEVLDLFHSNQLVGWGKLGESFKVEQLSVTLVATHPHQPVVAESFLLNVSSLADTVKDLCKILTVDHSKHDRSFLVLKCEHRHRHLASQIVNEVMNSYQSYLKKYHWEMALNQLDYLNMRKEKLTQSLSDAMKKHADYLSNDLYNSGFIESNKEMEFLAKNQHEYKRKLLDNELEIKRLTNIQPSNIVYYDHYAGNEGDPQIINQILAEIRQLKQSRDALEIELQKKSVGQNATQPSLEKQLLELTEVQQNLAELHEIVQQFQQGNVPNPNSKLLNDSRFLLVGWFERLQNTQSESPSKRKEAQESFQFYLNNLERLFHVYERILQERLIHHQNPSNAYPGITLEVAHELYLDYSKQLVQIEANMRQNLFFIHQIEDPNFEITSLSAGLEDPVSVEMIAKASQLVLNLRDQNNQSLKEQERIRTELNLQRTFLKMHLKQMVQLMELRKQLFDERISALRDVNLDLIYQNISLKEANLQDYLKARLDNLHQERILIKRHLKNIHSDMALLPQKWVSEKLLMQEIETNQIILEEIVKLVESKNISHNLDIIHSAPVDLAIPFLHPKIPKVLFLSILGFLLGGGLGSGFIIAKTLSKGLKVSTQNLELMGYHVSGTLSSPLTCSANHQLQSGNLNTLRRLQTYFDTSLAELSSSALREAKLLLLIEGQGPQYDYELANLFFKRGRRVMVLDLNFTEANTSKTPGLLQYLQGEITVPPIQKIAECDWMIAGGKSVFSIEMLSSPPFQKLIEQLKPHYDWILAVSHTLPCSVEAENLLSMFPNIAVTLQDEKTEELSIYTRFLEPHSPQKLTFILDRENES